MADERVRAGQALAQLKRSTEVAWHEQLYGNAAVIRQKQAARRLARQQAELDVRFSPAHSQLLDQRAPNSRQSVAFL